MCSREVIVSSTLIIYLPLQPPVFCILVEDANLLCYCLTTVSSCVMPAAVVLKLFIEKKSNETGPCGSWL